MVAKEEIIACTISFACVQLGCRCIETVKEGLGNGEETAGQYVNPLGMLHKPKLLTTPCYTISDRTLVHLNRKNCAVIRSRVRWMPLCQNLL